MNDNRDSRLRNRFVLITVILVTLPCYCTGLALVRFSSKPPAELPTSTPLWVQPATETAAAATQLVPSFTPYFATATLATETLSPTETPTATETVIPTASETLTPTPSQPSFPSDTPTPTETLPPTVTEIPTGLPYPLPSGTAAPTLQNP
jgi:hypothetical protein